MASLYIKKCDEYKLFYFYSDKIKYSLIAEMKNKIYQATSLNWKSTLIRKYNKEQIS